MTDKATGSGEPLDPGRLRELAELMEEHDLCEIDLSTGDTRIRLRRREGNVVLTESRPMAAPVAHAAPPVSATAAPADDAHLHLIKSPMVGTFYTASSPETPAFVKVGDHVGPDSVVCIVEAMKVFNEIPAEVSGKIVAVLAENGEPIEFGQPLFKVDTRR